MVEFGRWIGETYGHFNVRLGTGSLKLLQHSNQHNF